MGWYLALSVCVAAALTAPLVTSPAGFAWLPVVIVLKLTWHTQFVRSPIDR